ncbi:MAG: ABC transporter ATP-binding protein [Chloroflexi bacterium]|nr:ABC transporter ATP-binding protein [Chloroflexota bacterium]
MAGQEESKIGSSGPVRALDNLSLTIRDGETMAIVGPSGCGKSTLLRVVAGLETPDEGKVYFDGQDMADVKPKDRGIGMVFQNYALYPHMKGEGNLAFFFRVRHRPSEEMMERIRITSEIMGIGFDILLDRKPGTLSGGQQQRVAIGRCIVRDPSLFLFDEPLSNLDAKLRASTRIEIKRLLRRFNITAIYVTHDQTEAITLGDRIAVMRAGKIEQVGTYHEIIENPVNSFVAGFLGLPPMNLLEGWQATEEGELVGELGKVPIPKKLRPYVSPGQKITLGFRSSDATLVIEGQAPSDGLVLAAEVLNAEPNFAQNYQLVNVQAGKAIFGVQAPLNMPVNTGWQVLVVIDEARAYLFDAESEMRIAPPETEKVEAKAE